MPGVAALWAFRRAVAEFSFTDLDVVFRSGGTGYGATGPGLVGFNDQLRREISAYSAELALKPHCVVFTKMDLLGDDAPPPIDAPDAFAVVAISAAARTGLDPLLAAWWSRLLDMKKASVRRDESVQLP